MVWLMAMTMAAPQAGWAEFSRNGPDGSEPWSTTIVQIGTTGWDKDRKQPDYWMRMTHSADAKHGDNLWWANSRDCPVMRGVISAMADLPSPAIVPATGLIDGIEADGVDYTLSAPASSARITGEIKLKSNVDTPLAAWVDASLTALRPCWSRTIPPAYPR